MSLQAPVSVTKEQLGITTGLECSRHLDIDLGNLMAVHPSALDEPELQHFTEDGLTALTTRVTQTLIKEIFSLPSEATEQGRLVQLPGPQTLLPRAKPVPKPKPMTKWEKFAQEKGIQKRKRSKLVFDDNDQEWKRRHGYGRGNDEAAVPIIEASAADKDGEDPFTRMDRERKEAVKQSKKSHAKNMTDAAKQGALPATIKLSTKLDANTARGQIAKGKALKDDIKSASYLAGVSTASMGKFDARLKGERGSRKLPGLRDKHLPVAGGSEEKDMVTKATDKIMRSRDGELVNVRRAVGHFEAKKRKADFDAQENGSEQGGRKKGRVGRIKNRRVPKKQKAASTSTKGAGKKRKR